MARENGLRQHRCLPPHYRYQHMQLLQHRAYDPDTHRGNINALELDPAESRYLLAGAGDASIAVYDTQVQPGADAAGIAPLFVLRRPRCPRAHAFMVTCVAWYAVDSGLFVSGARDQAVKVWDTNKQEVLLEREVPAAVTCVAFSSVAVQHTLLAVTCMDQHLRLVDPASGAVTHTFSGHRDALWSVSWANTSEYHVVSGDQVGQVCLWDIRRAGCMAVLDQYDTQHTGPNRHSLATRNEAEGAGRGGSMASTPDAPPPGAHAKAHHGAVTCIRTSPTGLHLLTAGTDNRLCLWQSATLTHQLVNYPQAHNSAVRHRSFALSADSQVVFYPTGSVVNVYDTLRGTLLATLAKGHSDSLNCCVWNDELQELYTGANDHRILTWGVASRMERDDTDGHHDQGSSGLGTEEQTDVRWVQVPSRV